MINLHGNDVSRRVWEEIRQGINSLGQRATTQILQAEYRSCGEERSSQKLLKKPTEAWLTEVFPVPLVPLKLVPLEELPPLPYCE